jgi:hypothetical protein
MISSNPYHPLWPTTGITHTWMGESWMVDGETSVMMMMISSKSLTRQGARTEFLVLSRGFWWWRRSRTLSGKKLNPDVFRSEGICRRKEGSRRWLGRSHHPLAQSVLACATRWCEPLVAPLCLVFWLRVSSGKIETLRYFPGFFLKVRFLHKNETPEQF